MTAFHKMWLAVLAILIVVAFPGRILAHCDTLNGPVVAAAVKALETGDVSLVLIWVKPGDEAEIKRAFEQTLSVRKLGAGARELADRYFFETLVRIHRAGEGAPYTGLKSAEADPGIAAADGALEKGALDGVKSLLGDAVSHGLEQRYLKAMKAKNFDRANVAAGREYVAAYVSFLHYVEGVYAAASSMKSEHELEEEKHSTW